MHMVCILSPEEFEDLTWEESKITSQAIDFDEPFNTTMLWFMHPIVFAHFSPASSTRLTVAMPCRLVEDLPMCPVRCVTCADTCHAM